MNAGIGLEVTAQKAIFRSEQTSIETQFKEDERVRISFVIEKKAENRLIFVYINGEICGLIQYPEQDNFTQPIRPGSRSAAVTVPQISLISVSMTMP